MISSVMVISQQDDSSFRGARSELALCIDYASMGEPWTEFGKWFVQRYSGAPGIIERLNGIRDHKWIEFTKHDMAAVVSALAEMEHREGLTPVQILSFVGKDISTENW